MGDQGFNFSQPPRRERKTFEPPPWEREQHESHVQTPSSTDEQPPLPSVSEGEKRPVAEVAEGPKGEGKKRPPLDERQIAAMLIDLRVEEPPAMREVWKVAMVAAVIVGVVGIVFIMWGIAALATARRTGQIGLFGGVVLLLFGAGFIGAALWLAERTLRQRGVL